MIRKLTFAAGIGLLGLTLACSSMTDLLPGAEPTATPTGTPAIDASSGQGESGTDSSADEPEAEQEEPESDEQVGGQGPDSCLVGTWRADNDSFAGYLEDAFQSNAEGSGIEFTFEISGGEMLLTFTEDGQLSMSGEGVDIDMGISGLAAFSILLNAEGEADYAANGEVLATWNANYDSNADAFGQVLSQPPVGSQAELTLTPGMLFAYARSGPAELVITGVPDEASLAPYSCQGDTLILGVEDYQPVRWERAN